MPNRLNAFEVKTVLNLSKPFSFNGDADKCGTRNGLGRERWINDYIQKYQGYYHENSLHGSGEYHWDNICYEGKFYANDEHGYGKMSYPDGGYFEGLFKNNKRYGPGVYTYPDNSQDVGLWISNKLIRLTSILTEQCVPSIATTIKGKAYLNKYKKLIPISKPISPSELILCDLNALELINDAHHLTNKDIRNPKSLFFDMKSYDESYNQKVKVISLEDDVLTTEEETVTELLAWNNEPHLMELRKYIFYHRNFEDELTCGVDNIMGNRDLFSSPGLLELATEELFNTTCSDENQILNLITKFDLNPDICDKLGNTTVHCAVAKDNITALSKLVNFGANLDIFNDECLTPLLICLLRYVETKEKVINWQDAFLPSLERIRDTKQSYIFDISCKIVQLPAKKPKVKKIKKKKEKKVKEKKGKHKKGKKEIEEVQEIIPVEIEVDPEVLALENKLSTIRKTTSTLLCYGTDPNKGEVPLPPLFVSLFTFDEDIVYNLLKRGADSNLRNSFQDGYLTPLHVVTSMKLQPELMKLARILLENGANPDLRANYIHWVEEKNKLGDVDCYDEGKTPLHLLCMRYDFLEDESDNIGCLYDVMIELGCDPNLFYLGHTCLSLAVLRGNLKLIDHILKSYKINPNQQLGCDMGVPLTVLILKRYKNFLPLYACQDVFEILTRYKANPFDLISPDCNMNAIEFSDEENKPEGVGKKAKINKKEPHYKVIQALKKTAEVILNKHIMAKVIKNIFYYKIIGEFNNSIFDAMVQFLDVKEAQRILQILIDNGVIEVLPEEILSLLQYINSKSISKSKRKVKTPKHSKKSKISQQEEDPLVTFANNLQIQDLEFKEISLPEPEIDTQENKYTVCYNCFKKEGKTLVLCPNCELVYFCSVDCNKHNIKKKNTKHKCKGIFYVEELKKMLEDQTKLSTMQDLEDQMRLLMIGQGKDFSSGDTLKNLKSFTKEKMRIKELIKSRKERSAILRKNKDKSKKGIVLREDISKKDKSSEKGKKKRKRPSEDETDSEKDGKRSKSKEKGSKTDEGSDKKRKIKSEKSHREKIKKDKTDKGDDKSSKTKSEKEKSTKRVKSKTDQEDDKKSKSKLEKEESTKRVKNKKKSDKGHDKKSTKSEKDDSTKGVKSKKGEEDVKSESKLEKEESKKQNKIKHKTDKSDEKNSGTNSENEDIPIREKSIKDKTGKGDDKKSTTQSENKESTKQVKDKTYKDSEKKSTFKSEKEESTKLMKDKTYKEGEKKSRFKSEKEEITREKTKKEKTDKGYDKRSQTKSEREEAIRRDKNKKDKTGDENKNRIKYEKEGVREKTSKGDDKRSRIKSKEEETTRLERSTKDTPEKGDTKSKTKAKPKKTGQIEDEKGMKGGKYIKKQHLRSIKDKLNSADQSDLDQTCRMDERREKENEIKRQTADYEILLGDKLDSQSLTKSLEFILDLNKNYLPSVALINGELHYKFPKCGAYCKKNYSFV